MADLIEMADIRPDAMVVMTRVLPMVPLAGRPETEGYVHETLHMTRYDKVVAVTVVAAAPVGGDIIVHTHEDSESAEVDFVNLREGYRRDGWTVRDPEPWEGPDPLSEKAPF
jgi:hypothetical protein